MASGQDGHHRLEAYKLTKWKNPVPVKAVVLKQANEQRIKEAEFLSIHFNVKDKLPMSSADKLDTAWRVTLHYEGLSKAAVNRTTMVSTSLIGLMRKAKRVILASEKYDVEEMGSWHWARARYEYERVLDPDLMDKPIDNRNELQIRMVAKALSGILGKGIEANNIIEAFSRIDPSLIGQLEEAISSRKGATALGI